MKDAKFSHWLELSITSFPIQCGRHKKQALRAFRATNWNDVGNQTIFNFGSSSRTSRFKWMRMITFPFALDKPLCALNSGYSSKGTCKMPVSNYNSGKSLINCFRKINHSVESGDANKAEKCRNTLMPIFSCWRIGKTI